MKDYRRFKEINALFMQGRVREAQRMLMELQARYIALCDEVDILKKQAREMEDIFFLSQRLVDEGGWYRLLVGGVGHGPFCKSCYDCGGVLIRLEEQGGVHRCPYCGLSAGGREGAPEMRDPDDMFSLRGKVIPFPG
jgi:hypothetical protein